MLYMPNKCMILILLPLLYIISRDNGKKLKKNIYIYYI